MEKKISYKDLLVHKSFVFLLGANTLSIFGFISFQVVLFWLAYKMTDSAFEAGLVIQSFSAPFLLFGLIGGVYADQWNRKKMIIWCQMGTALMTLLVVGLYIFNLENIWLIALASFLIVSLRCFYSPAIRALVPQTLPEHLWPKGNSTLQICSQVSRSLAPVLAGAIMAVSSAEWIFTIFLAFTLASTLLIMPLKNLHVKAKGRVLVCKELKGTFAFIYSVKPLFWSLTLFGIVLLFYTGMERLGLPEVSDTVWDTGSKGFGTILTLFGVGSAIGAAIIGKVEIKSYSRYIFISCILWGLGLMFIGISPFFYAACAFALLTGMMEAFIDLPMVLMIQKSVPDEKIGKVYSTLSTIAFIGESGSSLIAGLLIGFAGTGAGFMLAAGGIAAVCGIGLFLTERKEKIPNEMSFEK